MTRAAPTPPPIALSILKTGYAWRCWHPVARAEDIGAAPVKAVLLDEQLVIYRIKGQVVVARDVCPHRGVPLTLGFHDEEGIVCPYHGLRFGEDGRCNRIPSSPDRPVPAKLNPHLLRGRRALRADLDLPGFRCGNPLPLPTLPHWDDEGFQQINCPAFEVNGFAGRQVEGFSMLPTSPGSIPTPLQIPIISWFPTISRRRPLWLYRRLLEFGRQLPGQFSISRAGRLPVAAPF
jgi:vanillate O-demethylase monooxygenase subunit